MRVLQVNKLGTAETGADRYFVKLTEQLIARGHDVAAVCMNPRDVPEEAIVFEVPMIDFHAADSVRARVHAARMVWWSRPAETVMLQALDIVQPDVVHFHNYAHQLSNSVVAAANTRAPTIVTAHDYKLICPAYVAMRDEKPCFRCADGSPVHCITGRCLQGSLSWSTLAAGEAADTRRRGDAVLPRSIIAPSQYMRERLADSWLKGTSVKLHHVANPVEPPPPSSPPAGGEGGIFVGRLAREKGVGVAIQAAAESGVRLTIVGEGPEGEALRGLAARLGAPVSFTGFLQGAELESRWAAAQFSVLPSLWPENAPLAVLESLVRGIPVVASDVGGMPEMIHRFAGGRVVPPGDVAALARGFRDVRQGPRPDGEEVLRQVGWPEHLRNVQDVYAEQLDAH